MTVAWVPPLRFDNVSCFRSYAGIPPIVALAGARRERMSLALVLAPARIERVARVAEHGLMFRCIAPLHHPGPPLTTR